jgi:hypothetical protein
MKTNMEEYHGTLTISSIDGVFTIQIEISTGYASPVMVDEREDYTIDDLHRFTHAARSRYRKFLNSKAADSFID